MSVGEAGGVISTAGPLGSEIDPSAVSSVSCGPPSVTSLVITLSPSLLPKATSVHGSARTFQYVVSVDKAAGYVSVIVISCPGVRPLITQLNKPYSKVIPAGSPAGKSGSVTGSAIISAANSPSLVENVTIPAPVADATLSTLFLIMILTVSAGLSTVPSFTTRENVMVLGEAAETEGEVNVG